jgi:hypothetical protein
MEKLTVYYDRGGNTLREEKGNSATRPPDKCQTLLGLTGRRDAVTLDGAALFDIDANCHEPLSRGGLPLRAIWHNGDITDIYV